MKLNLGREYHVDGAYRMSCDECGADDGQFFVVHGAGGDDARYDLCQECLMLASTDKEHVDEVENFDLTLLPDDTDLTCKRCEYEDKDDEVVEGDIAVAMVEGEPVCRYCLDDDIEEDAYTYRRDLA